MYRIVSQSLGRPPKNFGELHAAEKDVPGGMSDIGEENVYVFFGAALSDLEGAPGAVKSDKVLAYDRITPEQGGHVLLLDRTVQVMSREEFKAAPKAGEVALAVEGEPQKAGR